MIVRRRASWCRWWWLMLVVVGGASSPSSSSRSARRPSQHFLDRLMLKVPVIGQIMHNSAIARFARTLAVTFKAGVPLVEALETVAGATGNIVYEKAVLRIRDDVAGRLPGQHGDEAGQPVPAHGGADDRHRRRGRRARHHAVQGGRVLRAGSQQRGGRAVQPDRTDDHGHHRRAWSAAWSSACTCRSSSWRRRSADRRMAFLDENLALGYPAGGRRWACWSAASSTW